MSTRLNQFICAAAALLGAISVSDAQVSPPALEAPAHPVSAPASATKTGDASTMLLVQATAPTAPATNPATPTAPGTATTTTTTATTTAGVTDAGPVVDSGGVAVREFQG